MPGRRNRRRRGSVIVEFALAFPLLFAFLGGMFQFGYAFHIYNQIQSAIRNAGRYAATADFDGEAGGAAFRTGVRNMAVFGNPAGGTVPVAAGLATGNIAVAWQADGAGIPQVVSVTLNDFTLNGIWGSFVITGRPRSTFIYLGQFVS